MLSNSFSLVTKKTRRVAVDLGTKDLVT